MLKTIRKHLPTATPDQLQKIVGILTPA